VGIVQCEMRDALAAVEDWRNAKTTWIVVVGKGNAQVQRPVHKLELSCTIAEAGGLIGLSGIVWRHLAELAQGPARDRSDQATCQRHTHDARRPNY
jgi:hypothetical protein